MAEEVDVMLSVSLCLPLPLSLADNATARTGGSTLGQLPRDVAIIF